MQSNGQRLQVIYVRNNPVNLVDRDGRNWGRVNEGVSGEGGMGSEFGPPFIYFGGDKGGCYLPNPLNSGAGGGGGGSSDANSIYCEALIQKVGLAGLT